MHGMQKGMWNPNWTSLSGCYRLWWSSMKMNKLKAFIAAILCLSFLFIAYNAYWNLHVHEDGYGGFIIVSHPFDKDCEPSQSFPEHQHSRIELLFYFLVSVIECILVITIYFKFIKTVKSKSFLPLFNFDKSTPFFHDRASRAPPFCIVI